MGIRNKPFCIEMLAVLGAITLFSFQNCSPSGFEAASDTVPSTAAEVPVQSTNESLSAATMTAKSSSACADIGDFYWEVGDSRQMLGSGAIGTTYGADTSIAIASASKIVFGAFMVQYRRGNLSPREKQALRMLSGYGELNPGICAASNTVLDCLNAGRPGPNYKFIPANVDKFDYDGAHDQILASTAIADGGLGLGASTTTNVNALIMNELKNPGFEFSMPEFAGGVTASAAQFGVFLRGILSGELLLRDYLGAEKVCTRPGVCPSAVGSPVPLAWSYSYNHWVEDDPTGDGAFSSPGAFGFYPWISADKKLYGIISRKVTGGAAWPSVLCGQKIRKAWQTGLPQN